MKALFVALGVVFLTLCNAQAADQFVGTWGAGSKELLTITEDGKSYNAEFFRKNVKFEYEKVNFPALFIDGMLIISGELGDITVEYDAEKELLLLGGLKPFKRLSFDEAKASIDRLEKLKSR